ncbi:spindle assembly checkpoint protein Mad2p [Hesseltinella vesiculosa]|uniref:Spindle assembly checkpoint protein Mad2p n=1 Tax=Hesseltinella vesiculosa TaxID=101127 RepID=A0A1X2GIR4_9FUNG|nr:spindle assembly checkpoint protein Mad2p [Hesseltinella vesiculosa]
MATDSRIEIEGSSDIVVQFFECSLHSILYQRGVYPHEDFDFEARFGMNVLVSRNDELNLYLEEIIKQLHTWMHSNTIKKLVLVIKSKDTNETLERWQFDVKTTNDKSKLTKEFDASKSTQEIRAILRQITACVSFLPTLEDECTFNVLVYADKDVEVPTSWADSDANLIPGGGEHVRLRSFSTDKHKIEPIVAYQLHQ